jgi:predicted CoA-substrate-specific enzyme activase
MERPPLEGQIKTIRTPMKKRYVLGLDIGSSSSKAVILDMNREPVAREVVRYGAGMGGTERLLAGVREKTGLAADDMAVTVATGYGRHSVAFADARVSEITCHAAGAKHLFPDARTVIDIGGQDVKAISMSDDGKVLAFVMNDKCAAGTGRFLEVMSRVLDVPLDEMAAMDGRSRSPAAVSSTCAVFAESEVISLLSSNVKREDILRGVHESAAARAAALARKVKIAPEIVFTGGAALNGGLKAALERGLGNALSVSPYAQLAGAYGAALKAWDIAG